MSNISDFNHTVQLWQLNGKNSAILKELQDLKHVQLYGKTMAQAEAERRAIEELRLEQLRAEAYAIHCAEVDKYNASSDDEKFASDYSDYVTGSVICGLLVQIIAQCCIFNIQGTSGSLKNIIILEVSSILMHGMLQYFAYISFINNWTPKRKYYRR